MNQQFESERVHVHLTARCILSWCAPRGTQSAELDEQLNRMTAWERAQLLNEADVVSCESVEFLEWA